MICHINAQNKGYVAGTIGQSKGSSLVRDKSHETDVRINVHEIDQENNHRNSVLINRKHDKRMTNHQTIKIDDKIDKINNSF